MTRSRRMGGLSLVLTISLLLAVRSRAEFVEIQGGTGSQPAGGDQLYQSACAACHGADGRGAPPHVVGFDTPLPDFTDCSFVTVEPDDDWIAVSHDGGPARAFDRRMPAFGGAMSESELQQVLDYIRGFCTNPAWPRGELNLPRALFTEKAYPENEAVLTTTVGATGTGRVANELLYEQRLGPRSQFEILVPLLAQDGGDEWHGGLGDVAVAVKHALFHSFARGNIFSVAGEIVLPTGKEADGRGVRTDSAGGGVPPASGRTRAAGGPRPRRARGLLACRNRPHVHRRTLRPRLVAHD
jgi:hypothetical protein